MLLEFERLQHLLMSHLMFFFFAVTADIMLFSGKSELWGQFAFSSVLTLLGVGHDIKLGWCCG